MEEAIKILEHHGYWVVFLFTLLDFLGVPMAAPLLLFIAGALATTGYLSWSLVALLAAAAATLGESFWYGVGRFKGQLVLRTICRLSRNRTVCVARAHSLIARYGAASLLMAKFIPGLATVVPPAAGAGRMVIGKFMFLSAASSLAWAAAYSGAGYVLGKQAQSLAGPFHHLVSWGGMSLAIILILAILIPAASKALFDRTEDSSSNES